LLPCFWKCRAGVIRFYFPKTERVGTTVSILQKEPFIFAFIYTLFTVSLASPIFYDRISASERNGRDLVLALDSSGSMAESGFDTEKKNLRKYDVLLNIVEAFIDKRFDDNIGLVIFGSFSFTAAPVTYDLVALKEILHLSDVAIAGESTAIGEGIYQSLRTLKFGKAKKKAIILITDGYQNAGSVSIKDAVEMAKREGVKIYTIGIGKKGMFDEKLLKKISAETGGQTFSAVNSDDLKSVFSKIDSLEPSPIRSHMLVNKKMLYIYPLILGMILLIGLRLNRKSNEVALS